MKNVFRVGFCAVAIAMTTGCMAEAMDDEVIAEASAEVAADTCGKIGSPSSATINLAWSGYSAASGSSTSPSSAYGTADCPDQHLVDVEFASEFYDTNRSYYVNVEPMSKPTTAAACEDTFVELSLWEADTYALQGDLICGPRFCYPGPGGPNWKRRVTKAIQGSWNGTSCDIRLSSGSLFNWYRSIPRFGSRVAARVYRSNNVSQRVTVSATTDTVIR